MHNLSWVPGHGHLTMGTAVTLTFMGITHWLVPHLSRRACGTDTWPWLVVVGLLTLTEALDAAASHREC